MTLTVTQTKAVPIPVAKIDLTTMSPVNVSLASSAQVGFSPSGLAGEPEPSSWFNASSSWLVNASRALYWLAPLIGPLGLAQLAVGLWVPWVWIVLGSEVIRQPVPDTLTVIG